MKFRYKITYKNKTEVIVDAESILELLNNIAKCISDEAYVKFTDVYTFFDGYTHKTIKQNKYMHVLPSFIALLKSEYTIKSVETLTPEESIRIENFCNMFDKSKFDKVLPEVIIDIYKDSGYFVRMDDEGTETTLSYDLVKNHLNLYDIFVNTDDNDITYISLFKKEDTALKKNEIVLYAVTPGFNYDNKSFYYSRIRKIMEYLISENNTYSYNGVEFSLECDRDAKDKYRFRSIDKERYMTIAFVEDAIDALNYAGDVKLNGNMIFTKVAK